MRKLIAILTAAVLCFSAARAQGQFRRVKDIAKRAVKAASERSGRISNTRGKTRKKGARKKAAAKKRAATKDPAWVKPMRDVHAKFKGTRGTFAHFGDSITASRAFWSSMKYSHKNMDKDARAAFNLVKAYMRDECWSDWKEDKFGNKGRMTIRWAHKNVDTWLKTLKPEAALIMFGTNDLHALKVEEYEKKTREVVQKCLDNGTVVILSTIPPRHRYDAKAKTFVQAVRRIAKDMKVPLCDYYKAIMDRRPDDWDGTLAKFDEGGWKGYDVPTLIARDGVHPSNCKKHRGDYSKKGLKNNGFVLRNYVVVHAYAEAVRKVFKSRR
ncbi:hypothetical protein LCGC14_2134930 [marine sediment metagenome]|uniref:SGNH hydrolase-type esterase domain-containing protein n=1 Tax=marine sediment metagenome TaxID=412755 RepID=A0A0F9E097_9ZZZZ